MPPPGALYDLTEEERRAFRAEAYRREEESIKERARKKQKEEEARSWQDWLLKHLFLVQEKSVLGCQGLTDLMTSLDL